MNTKLIWIVVAAGGAWYILRKRGAPAPATSRVATLAPTMTGDGKIVRDWDLSDVATLSAGSVDGPAPASVMFRRLGTAGLA